MATAGGQRHVVCLPASSHPLPLPAVASPNILLTQRSTRPPSASRSGATGRDGLEGAAFVAIALGATFAFVGLADLVLAWWPVAFGSPEWEFGTVTSTMNGLPVPVMGLALLLAGALAAGRHRTASVVSGICFVLAIATVGLAILWATTLPFAFQPVANDVVRLGLVKAVAKTALQLVAYPVLFVVLGIATRRYLAR